MFSTTGFGKGWNGTFGGRPLDSGVLVWVVRATDELTGAVLEQKGTVMLIR